MQSPLVSLFWFVAVLALIPLALWLFKRSPMGGGLGSAAGVVRTVATLPLGAQQRIVTVEVGQGDDRRWLVLGITPQSITTLHSLAPQAAPDPGPQQQPPFAQLMERLRRGNDGAA